MADEHKVSLQTLIFVLQEDQILLGLKRRGFGNGKWNGYGGKVEESETIKSCAQRELYEESQLAVEQSDLKHIGYIQFKTTNDLIIRKVHIYTTRNVTGIVKETEEMQPNWFKFNDIPYNEMLSDASYWIPLVLKDTQFEGTFTVTNNNTIKTIHIDIKTD